MKKKHLLLALATPVAFLACTNEDLFTENSNKIANNDEMINTSELNFTVSRGDEATTRALWEADGDGNLNFFWENDDTQAIGLAYVGKSGGSVSAEGVTNYKFVVDSLRLTDYEVKSESQVRWTGFFQLAESADDVNAIYNGSFTADDLKTSTEAKFKTVNDQILKGKYVAYYPFNEKFTEPGKIMFSSPQTLNTELTDNLAEVGKVTFAYSAPAETSSGKQVSYFNMQNLSSVFKVHVLNTTTSPVIIKQVIIRTTDANPFIIDGTINDPSIAPSATNITASKDGKSTILAVNYSTALGVSATDGTLDAYIPFIPVAVGELEVILVKSDGSACVIKKSINTTLKAGVRTTLNATIDANTKFDQSFVLTSADFVAALNTQMASTTPATINLLGNIDATGIAINSAVKANVTIVGSTYSSLKMAGNIVQPEGSTLTFKVPVGFGATTLKGGNVVFENGVNSGALVLGDGVATNVTFSGESKIEGGTFNTTVTADGKSKGGITVAENATLTVSKDKTLSIVNNMLTINGSFTVNGTLANTGSFSLEKGTLTVAGKMTNASTGIVDVKSGSKIALAGTIESSGKINTASGSNLEMSSNSAFHNMSTGIVGNLGTFTNEGTLFDYAGSYYGGKAFEGNGSYACYVNSQATLVSAVEKLNEVVPSKNQMIILQTNTTVGDAYNFGVIAAADAKKLTVKLAGDNVATIVSNDAKATPAKVLQTIKGIIIDASAKANALTISDNLNINGDVAVTKGTLNILGLGSPAAAVVTVKVNGKISTTTNSEISIKATNKAYCKDATVATGTWDRYPTIDPSAGFWN